MATTKFGTLEVAELFVAGERVEGGVVSVTHTLPVLLPVVPDSEATTVKALVSDYNALLSALRAARVLAKEKVTT